MNWPAKPKRPAIELTSLEEERESLRKKLERGDGLFNKLLNSANPAELRTSLNDIEKRIKELRTKLELLAPQVEQAKQQSDFVKKDNHGRLGDYLNDPENARRLFDPLRDADENERAARDTPASQLTARLEERELILHILASYEIRPVGVGFLSSGAPAAAEKGLVSKEESRRVEELLKQVPAKRLSMKPIEELTKRIEGIREKKFKPWFSSLPGTSCVCGATCAMRSIWLRAWSGSIW